MSRTERSIYDEKAAAEVSEWSCWQTSRISSVGLCSRSSWSSGPNRNWPARRVPLTGHPLPHTLRTQRSAPLLEISTRAREL